MYYFILLSLHCGFASLITGIALGARNNWIRGSYISSVLGWMHMSLWVLCWVGFTLESYGEIAWR